MLASNGYFGGLALGYWWNKCGKMEKKMEFN